MLFLIFSDSDDQSDQSSSSCDSDRTNVFYMPITRLVTKGTQVMGELPEHSSEHLFLEEQVEIVHEREFALCRGSRDVKTQTAIASTLDDDIGIINI